MKTVVSCARPGVLLVAAMGVCALATPGQAGMMIDNWSVHQGPMVNFDFSGNTVTGSMLGGQRKMYLQNISGQGQATAEVANGMLHMTRTADAFPDVSQIWDGGVNQRGLGGIDITQGGENDRLRVFVRTNGRASVGVYISQDFGFRSLGYFNIPGPGAGNYDLLFSNIRPDNVGAPGADLRHVGAIYFDVQLDYYTFAAPSATDFQMGAFSIVPAPGAAAVLGLAGLAGLRRRR
ncbi:MAG: hypothetical protein JSR77_13435 [Planctomycetes bacterium]|nr:hypothetical protein [Planctomycetota bacterium]